MNIFNALQLIQVNHQPLNYLNVIITDDTGKPDAIMSDLLADVLGKLAIFGDLSAATTPSDLINQFRECTPLPEDVLNEYDKILTQTLSGINFVPKKQIVELIYKPFI